MERYGQRPYPPRTVLEARKLDQDDIAEVDATFYAPFKKKRVKLKANKD